MEYLNLKRAARLLADLTSDPSATDDVQAIIRAGAARKIPIYWFNDLHQGTYVADYTDSEHRSLKATYSDGPQQMTHTSLRELAMSESLAVFDFEFTEGDYTLLEKIKGKAVDDDGNLLGYRRPANPEGTVTITRDQLFVYAHDLKAYAATLSPDEVVVAPARAPAPANPAQSVDQVQTVNAIPGEIVKRGALITRNKAKWKTIDHDLSEASRNGLSEAARAEKKGWWLEANAIKWAEINNKFEAPKSMANTATSVLNKLF